MHGHYGDFDADLYVAAVLETAPDNDRVDGAVQVLLAAHEGDQCTEHSARAGIATLLWYAAPHRRALGDTRSLSSTDVEDLADAVVEVVIRKVLDNSRGNGYRLDLGRDRSACGWAWCLARQVVMSERRRMWRARRRNGALMDPSSYSLH